MEDIELYAREWCKMVWFNNFHEEGFENWEEMADSLVAYIKGEEHPTHQYAIKE